MIFKVLVVAGGRINSVLGSSTETLIEGSSSWVESEPLPRNLCCMAWINLEDAILIFGIYDLSKFHLLILILKVVRVTGVANTMKFCLSMEQLWK